MNTRRLFALGTLVLALPLGGCGFALRHAPDFAFKTLWITTPDSSALGNSLKRKLAASGSVSIISDAKQIDQAQAILDITQDQRDRVVVGSGTVGQVRNYQLRVRIKFRLRTPQGKELIPETEILQQRDISYNETAALAKEAEQNFLYRDMQTDIEQQLMRRLAAVKSL